LNPEVYDQVVANTLTLQDQDYSKHTTTYGEILLDPEQKGKVYSGGLFVGVIRELAEGFNLKPEFVKLDRDRSFLDSFETKWITKEAWGEVAQEPTDTTAKYIAESLVKGGGSTQFLHHAEGKVSDKVLDEVFNQYEEKYSGKILVESHEEKSKLQATGNKLVDFIGNDGFLKILKQSPKYKEIVLNTKLEKPEDLLYNFKDKYYNEMSPEMLDDFEDLTEKLNKLI
jgi:hypothetical protein